MQVVVDDQQTLLYVLHPRQISTQTPHTHTTVTVMQMWVRWLPTNFTFVLKLWGRMHNTVVTATSKLKLSYEIETARRVNNNTSSIK